MFHVCCGTRDGDRRRSRHDSGFSSINIGEYPLLKRAKGEVEVLDKKMAGKIRQCLPPRYKDCKQWNLVYSTDNHGSTLQTLYKNASAFPGAWLLIIKTMEDEIAGCFGTETWRPERCFYGNGESFLFRFDDNDCKVYYWTGANFRFQLSDKSCISMGISNGRYGLWLDKFLDKGQTDCVDTFENEPLCKSPFSCLCVELWSFNVYE